MRNVLISQGPKSASTSRSHRGIRMRARVATRSVS